MLRLLCVLLTSLVFGNGSAYAVEAFFLDNAQVSSSVIRLSDIVQFSEINEEVRVLQNQIIADSPRLGSQLIVKRHHILRQLASKNPLPPEIRWTGADSTSITIQEISLSSKRILGIINTYLQKRSDALPNVEFIFTPTELPAQLTLPPGKLTTAVTASKKRLIGSNRFSIAFRINGKLKKNLSIRGTLQVMAPVYVAQTDINRGSALSDDLFSVEVRDINNIKKPFTANESLSHKQVTRPLREGDILSYAQIESIPLVHRGDSVKVRLNSNGLNITMTGIARANGGLNDVIRVQNTSSNKIFYAKVLAPGLVEVRI